MIVVVSFCSACGHPNVHVLQPNSQVLMVLELVTLASTVPVMHDVENTVSGPHKVSIGDIKDCGSRSHVPEPQDVKKILPQVTQDEYGRRGPIAPAARVLEPENGKNLPWVHNAEVPGTSKSRFEVVEQKGDFSLGPVGNHGWQRVF